MNIKTISTKELREDFSTLRRSMQRGEPLLLLYRSQPLAEIRPVRTKKLTGRSFSSRQLKQWIADDELSVAQQSRVDEIINRLSR